MENITHSLFGAALYYAGGKRFAPRTLPLWIIGANLPDIDVVTQFVSRLTYLEHHRGLTHTALAILPLTTILTISWQLWARYRGDFSQPQAATAEAWSNTPDHPTVSPNPGWKIGCAALVTIISHTSLDWLNNYGVRPALPFSNHWFYGDLVFIADPWIWLLLSGAILLQPQLSWAWQRFFAIFAALATLLVLGTTLLPIPALNNNLIPWPGKLLWVTAILALIFWRYRRHQQNPQFVTPLPDATLSTINPDSAMARQAQRTAQIALGLLASYLLLLYLSHRQTLPLAQQYLARQTSEPLRQISLSPNLANPFNWHVFAISENYFYRGKISLWNAFFHHASSTPLNQTDFPVTRYSLANQHLATRQALQTVEGQVLQNFCRYLLTDVIEFPAYYRVILHDGRYSPDPHQPGFARLVIDIPRPHNRSANGNNGK
jgi:inner membrane protein